MTTTYCHTENACATTNLVVGEGIEPVSTSVDLGSLYRQLLAIDSALSFAELADCLEPLLATSAIRFIALGRKSADGDCTTIEAAIGDIQSLSAAEGPIRRAAQLVTDEHVFEVETDTIGDLGRLVACALPGPSGQPLVAVTDPNSDPQKTLLILQAIALQIGAWQAAQEQHTQTVAARQLATLTELVSRLSAARTVSEASQMLAEELQQYLNCQQVVIGLCRDESSPCQVKAFSGVDAFHSHSKKARIAQAALQEAIARGGTSVWPVTEDIHRYGMKAIERFADSSGADVVVASALRDESGGVQGAWLFVGSADSLQRPGVPELLDAAQGPVASTLNLLVRAQGGWVRRTSQSLVNLVRRKRGQSLLAALALAVGLLFVPIPYRVNCDCQLEPVVRRFVAAPFDGPLKKSFVKPGDLVTQHQLLARIDEREVRWELAGIQAELFRAAKQRAGHVASHEAGAAAVAQHDMDRLQYREQLLKARDQDLDIRSPVDGMIVSGDLTDAEGMPLKVGEVLFEVAPLDVMNVELSVPEEMMTHVRKGMPVHITFDAFPFLPYDTQVDRVHPRAELRDEQNVFIAEVRLENPRQALRPGMRGHARIELGTAPAGWVFFRRPLAAVLEWLGW